MTTSSIWVLGKDGGDADWGLGMVVSADSLMAAHKRPVHRARCSELFSISPGSIMLNLNCKRSLALALPVSNPIPPADPSNLFDGLGKCCYCLQQSHLDRCHRFRWLFAHSLVRLQLYAQHASMWLWLFGMAHLGIRSAPGGEFRGAVLIQGRITGPAI